MLVLILIRRRLAQWSLVARFFFSVAEATSLLKVCLKICVLSPEETSLQPPRDSGFWASGFFQPLNASGTPKVQEKGAGMFSLVFLPCGGMFDVDVRKAIFA